MQGSQPVWLWRLALCEAEYANAMSKQVAEVGQHTSLTLVLGTVLGGYHCLTSWFLSNHHWKSKRNSCWCGAETAVNILVA